MSQPHEAADLAHVMKSLRRNAKRALDLERQMSLRHQWLVKMRLEDDMWSLGVPLLVEHESATISRGEGSRHFTVRHTVTLGVDTELDPEDPAWIEVAEADEDDHAIATFVYSQTWDAQRSLKNETDQTLSLFANSVGRAQLTWAVRDFITSLTVQMGRRPLVINPPESASNYVEHIVGVMESLLAKIHDPERVRTVSELITR